MYLVYAVKLNPEERRNYRLPEYNRLRVAWNDNLRELLSFVRRILREQNRIAYNSLSGLHAIHLTEDGRYYTPVFRKEKAFYNYCNQAKEMLEFVEHEENIVAFIEASHKYVMERINSLSMAMERNNFFMVNNVLLYQGATHYIANRKQLYNLNSKIMEMLNMEPQFANQIQPKNENIVINNRGINGQDNRTFYNQALVATVLDRLEQL